MRNYKNRFISSVFLVLIILSSAGVFFPIKNSSFEPISEWNDGLNLSDDELVIITPENKTYIEPMNGYYPATYGFENDEDGTAPEEWIDQDASQCHSQVISELDGHSKILRQIDGSSGTGAVVKRPFTSPQDHGTIEYYVRTSLMTGGAKMCWYLWSASGLEIWMVMGDSKLTYLDGAIWQEIIPSGLTANTWYHFSVRWRCTGAPVYEGLNEGEWKIFIDEVEYGNYALGHDDNMTNVNLETGPGPLGFDVYWDAVGFDWRNGYEIGDNLNEGLLLSFENTTTFDWIGYSLDGQANKTILGNTTIQMPDDGLHTIQISGYSSLGTTYQSDIRHFSVNTGSPIISIITPIQNEFFGVVPPNFELSILKPDISKIWYTLDNGITNITSAGLTGTIDQIEWKKKGVGPVTIGFYANDTLGFEGYAEVTVNKIAEIIIDSPENKTYSSSMSGYYPATYGFENDADESSPKGWDNPTAGAPYLKVVSERFGRKKVIEAYDSGPFTGWIASHYFNNTEGTIEFWWAVSSVAAAKSHMVVILDSTLVPLFGVQVSSGQIQVLTGGIWFSIPGLTTTANTWDHVRLDFRSDLGSAYQGMTQNQYRIYYNGIDEGTYNFQNIGDPNNTRLYSGLTPVNVYGYYDAFGFSWDPNYEIGDNLNEGLHLSFENTTVFDWMSYSLDGQANKTILGNTTIQMPDDGLHTIQVFGNNSLGTISQSDVRHFSVDIGSPEITIITPIQNEFFGVVPPNFDISILKPDITKIWYTLDGGITNVTIVGLTGTINQTEWDKIVADVVTIKFYANDTFGFVGNAEVVIKKDLNPPQSSISREGLTFTITAEDGLGSGVSVLRYKINGSAWIDYTSPFNLDYGNYNITYQAIDAVGNVEEEGVLIIALNEPDIVEDPPDWTIFIMTASIIGGIGLVIVIALVIRKRK